VISRGHFKEIVLVLGVLGLVGTGDALWRRPASPQLDRTTEGYVLWAELGGVRKAVAGFLWVEAYEAWRERDERSLKLKLNRVVRMNPQQLEFWLNGARMLAFDVAVWRSEVAPEKQRQIRQEQLRAGLAWLRLAEPYHGEKSALWIERAALHWMVNQDAAAVEQALSQAQIREDAPGFVGRLRAEMLLRMGRLHEALALLEEEELTAADSESPENKLLRTQRMIELEQLLGSND